MNHQEYLTRMARASAVRIIMQQQKPRKDGVKPDTLDKGMAEIEKSVARFQQFLELDTTNHWTK